jgi:hypothetical protein
MKIMKKLFALLLLAACITQTAQAGWWCDTKCEIYGGGVYTVCAAGVGTAALAGGTVNGATLEDCVEYAADAIVSCWESCE